MLGNCPICRCGVIFRHGGYDEARRAGVPVEFHMYPGAYHGFYRVTHARVTKQAEHDTREALRRFLHG